MMFDKREREKSVSLIAWLHDPHELALLGRGLETTMTKLGTGIDELERSLGNLLERRAALLWYKAAAESEHSLLWSDDASLHHEEIVLDDTIVWETAHRCDALLGEIKLGGGVLLVVALADAVDLLVDLGTMVVTVLTGASDGVRDTSRMPRADAGDLAETLESCVAIGEYPNEW